jgi:hypothetical protein
MTSATFAPPERSYRSDRSELPAPPAVILGTAGGAGTNYATVVTSAAASSSMVGRRNNRPMATAATAMAMAMAVKRKPQR